LIWGRVLYFDATKVEANAGIPSLAPRFYHEAKTHLAGLFGDELTGIVRNGKNLGTLPEVENVTLAPSQGHQWPRRAARRRRRTTMTIQRMDNVAIVVDDLEGAMAFFVELGMELEGTAQIEGRWADRTVGLDGVRSDIAMMRTPDGHGRLELTKYHTPAAVSAEPENPPPNTLGLHRVMFAVDDIDDVVARLRAHGAELLGEVVQYEDSYRLCYVRGPEGIIVGLAEQLS
jgi:catechol 2,3-dioxygenase-like lactoylglutathione lyase family enzyme